MRGLTLLATLGVAVPLFAHNVVTYPRPLILQPGSGQDGVIAVEPVLGERCDVSAGAATLSTLISITPPDSVALTVVFTVAVKRNPVAGNETALVEVTWKATGQANGKPDATCNASGASTIAVTVSINPQPPILISVGEQPNSAMIGDPVSTSTGETTSSGTDLYLGGPLPLFLARHYGSMLSASGVRSALGTNWMHNFDASLISDGHTALVTLFRGKQVQFHNNGTAWELQSLEQGAYQLAFANGTYQFLDFPNNVIYSFDNDGFLTSVRDRNGNTLLVTQGTYGPALVADGLGRTLIFNYTGNLLTSVQDQTGRTVTYNHTGSNLTGIVDAGNQQTRFRYSAGALTPLASTIMPAGNIPSTQAFDASGRAVRQTDSLNNATGIAYNVPSAQMRTITNALNQSVQHTYDASGNLTRTTDASGSSTTFTYDANSRMLSATDANDNRTLISYHAVSGLPSTVTDPLGNATRYTFTAQNQGPFTYYTVTTIDYADASSDRYTYDSSGNILTFTDRAGNVQRFTYNSRGQILTSTNAAGAVAEVAYNADGNPATSKGYTGNATAFTYDSRKRVTQVTFPDGTSVKFTWDAMNRPVSLTDERGKVTMIAYDQNGNARSIADPLQRAFTVAYDTDDLPVSIGNRLGARATHDYNSVGLIRSFTNAVGERTSFTYDSVDRVKTVSDSAGKMLTFEYDRTGSITALADAAGNRRTFTVDALGRTVRTVDALGGSSTGAFDSMGRMVSAANPLGQIVNYSYDSRGFPAAIQIPEAISLNFAYDALGNLSRTTDPNGNMWASLFDNAGRLVSQTDPLGRVVTIGYDSRDRATAITTPLGAIQFSYNNGEKPAQIRYAGGSTDTYTYDDNNRMLTAPGMTRAYDAEGRIISSNGISSTRDALGRITAITYAPGKTVFYAYNSRGLVARITDWTGAATNFTYDDNGRIASIVRASGASTQLTHDRNGRLASITEAAPGQTLASTLLERDAAGRIVAATRNTPKLPDPGPGILGIAFDAAGQARSFTYDANGRLTRDDIRTYNWNLASELTSYTGSTGSASFTYDGLGMRTSRTAANTTESYVWNYALGLPALSVVKSGATDQRYYVYTPGGSLLYAVDAASNRHHYYHFDEAGSTTILTDDTGRITDSYGISPYGETVSVSGSTPNPFTWQGQFGVMQEGSQPLYYMRIRYYDASTGRFLSQDPVLHSDPRASNPYQFAFGDPLGYADPMGAKGQSTSQTFWSGQANDLLSHYNLPAQVYYIGSEILNAKAASKAAFALAEFSRLEQLYYPMQAVLRQVEAEATMANWLNGTTEFSHLSLNFPEFQWRVMDKYGKIQQTYLNKFTPYISGIFDLSKTFAKFGAILQKGGFIFAAVGTTLQATTSVVEDIRNGAGVVVTATDGLATVCGQGLTFLNPVAAALDLVTFGLVSNLNHNALAFVNTAAVVATTNVNTQQQTAIKKVFTKHSVTKAIWNWADKASEDSLTVKAFTWIFTKLQ